MGWGGEFKKVHVSPMFCWVLVCRGRKARRGMSQFVGVYRFQVPQGLRCHTKESLRFKFWIC